MAAEDQNIHPNNLRASQLIFGTMILGFVWELFMNPRAMSGPSVSMIFTFVLLGGIAVLVRKGYTWVKYVLLVMTVLGVLITPFIFSVISRSPMHVVIYVAQTIMQIVALVLMFKAQGPGKRSGS